VLLLLVVDTYYIVTFAVLVQLVAHHYTIRWSLPRYLVCFFENGIYTVASMLLLPYSGYRNVWLDAVHQKQAQLKRSVLPVPSFSETSLDKVADASAAAADNIIPSFACAVRSAGPAGDDMLSEAAQLTKLEDAELGKRTLADIMRSMPRYSGDKLVKMASTAFCKSLLPAACARHDAGAVEPPAASKCSSRLQNATATSAAAALNDTDYAMSRSSTFKIQDLQQIILHHMALDLQLGGGNLGCQLRFQGETSTSAPKGTKLPQDSDNQLQDKHVPLPLEVPVFPDEANSKHQVSHLIEDSICS